MEDYSYSTEEKSILTGYDPDDSLTNHKSQKVSQTSNILNLDDAFNEDFISVFNLESAGDIADNLTYSYTKTKRDYLSDEKSVNVTSMNDLATSHTDTVGVSSVSNNLATGYDNQGLRASLRLDINILGETLLSRLVIGDNKKVQQPVR